MIWYMAKYFEITFCEAGIAKENGLVDDDDSDLQFDILG